MLRVLTIAIMLFIAGFIAGYPLGSFMDLCIVMGVFVFLLNTTKSQEWRHYGYGVCLLLVGGLFLSCLPDLKIEEGHNLFLKSEKKDPFLNEIPEVVYADFDFRFLAAYPIEDQCVEGGNWCWKTKGIPDQVFAFSSDSIFGETPKYSRLVDRIRFFSLSDLKTGFVNDYDSCFFDDISDVKRNTLPFFVKWDVNESMIGGTLYWSGNMWIGGSENGFKNIVGNNLKQTFLRSDLGKEIWVSRIAPNESLSATFQPSFHWVFITWSKKVIAVVLLVAVLAIFCVKVRFNLLYESIITVAALGVLIFMSPAFVFGHPALWGGGDGLWTEGFAFWITQAFAGGDLVESWRGGENAYYLMPYLRYIRSIEDFIFGDCNSLMVLITLFLPISMYRILIPFTSRKIAFYITLGFVFFPWHFGFNRWAELSVFGLSETVAFVCLMPALIFLTERKIQSSGRFLFVSAILGIAIGLRPNYLPVAFLLFVFGAVALIRSSTNNYRTVLTGFALLGIVIMLIPLHNFVFAGSWVPFTTGYHQVKTIEWFDWIIAAKDCIVLQFDSESIQVVVEQLNQWLFADPKIFYKLGDMSFVRKFITVTNPLVVIVCSIIPFCRFVDPRVRQIAVLAVVAQGVTLLFAPTGRYSYLAWDLCWISIILFYLSCFPTNHKVYGAPKKYLFSLK